MASSVSPRSPAIYGYGLVAVASSRLKKQAQKANLRLQLPGLQYIHFMKYHKSDTH